MIVKEAIYLTKSEIYEVRLADGPRRMNHRFSLAAWTYAPNGIKREIEIAWGDKIPMWDLAGAMQSPRYEDA